MNARVKETERYEVQLTTIEPTTFFAGPGDTGMGDSLSSKSVLSMTTIVGVGAGVCRLVEPPCDEVLFTDWLREC